MASLRCCCRFSITGGIFFSRFCHDISLFIYAAIVAAVSERLLMPPPMLAITLSLRVAADDADVAETFALFFAAATMSPC